MKIILNNHRGVRTFGNALADLVRGADTLSLAVSYMQVGGWDLVQQYGASLNFNKMRIVCTDQFGITQPAAIVKAQMKGVQIRNYSGNLTYHPKVYLAHNRLGRPTRLLVASANLSYSAFTESVEAGMIGNDKTALKTIDRWFNDLFRNQSNEFTPEQIRIMQTKWQAAAARRTRGRLRIRRALVADLSVTPAPLEAEDMDALEDVFATVQIPIGLLNMDYAGNNVRNVDRVRELLANWYEVSASTSSAAIKQRSEMKLLGFADGHNLTQLGIAASTAEDREQVARLWCTWLCQTPDSELEIINGRLLIAKKVFAQFWRLQPEVRDYFLTNAERPDDRQTLQTIELLSNAHDIVQELSLEDFRSLSPLLTQPQRLPLFVRQAIADYQDNKGNRGWDFPDRRIVPQAWRDTNQVS